MRNCINSILITILVSTTLSAIAQDNVPKQSPSLFQDEHILHIALSFDITTHIRRKSEEYSHGHIVIYQSETDSTRYPVRCRARGNFRKDHCSFPPIMLNFKPDTLFTADGYLTKLKLVSHCQNSKLYRENLFKEYLIYKLWEILSPYALRTRLVDIQYQDTGTKKRNSRQFAFLIEPMYMMAQRTRTIEIKGDLFKDEEINELDADRVAIFNYMIGNTDWRIKGGHNVLFIKRFGFRREEVTAIPYDFDHAGFINAPYANPAEWSSAEKVTERDYTGRCRETEDNYHIIIEEYLAVEDLIYQTIMEFELLDVKARKQAHKYIASFYKELKNTKSFIRSLQNSCMERY